MFYKDYYITTEDFGYTVFFQGDEIVFSTIVEAEEFIDSLED